MKGRIAIQSLQNTVSAQVNRYTLFLSRRPHRSFRRTRRRDYVRSLTLPGYISFTRYVVSVLAKRRATYITLAAIFAVLNTFFVGVSSQDAYTTLSSVVSEAGKSISEGGWGRLGDAGIVLGTGIAGSFAPQLSEVQQVYAVFFVLLVWLSTVWLLRAQLLGKHPPLRDALYSSGAPLVATGIVFIIIAVQLVPLALAVLGINIANQTGFIASGGLLSMVAWLVAVLISVVSIYWISSTMIAMVIETLPGMRPFEAIKTAGDIVIGRRLRIALRLLWLIVVNIVAYVCVVLPAILFDQWLNSFLSLSWLPLVPFVITIVTSLITVFSSAYIYLLYRKVVEDDADPA